MVWSVRIFLTTLLILLGPLCAVVGSRPAVEDIARPVVQEQDGDARVKILPTLELISGVLLHTSWADEFGPHSGGNEYAVNLSAQFAGRKEHPAVRGAEELIDSGFRHDAFPRFAVLLAADADLSQRHPYDGALIRRARGAGQLEQFRRNLAELAHEAEFFRFFSDNQNRYERLVHQVGDDLTAAKLIGWMESFYGWRGDRYVTVLAPAMFPSGGYGGSVVTADGELWMLNVIRAADETGPVRFPRGEDLAALALHEWGHSYVDPALAEHRSRVAELDVLFEAVESEMRRQEYTNVYVFANEQVLRAICALAMRDLYGESAYARDVARNEERGFYLTAHLAEFIEEEYRANRERYPTFSDFVPDLVHEMTLLEPEDFPVRRWPVPPGAVRPLFLGSVVLIAVIWWLTVGLRRRRQQIMEMDEDEIFWDEREE